MIVREAEKQVTLGVKRSFADVGYSLRIEMCEGSENSPAAEILNDLKVCLDVMSDNNQENLVYLLKRDIKKATKRIHRIVNIGKTAQSSN